MTREEALQILDTIPTIGEQVDALEMAIEALEQEPCEDCISRDAVQNYVESHIQEINTGYGDLNNHTNRILRMIVDGIGNLPSIQPKTKTGHWIDHQEGRWIYAKCSECGTVHDTQTNYCPNCGAKMESEDKE